MATTLAEQVEALTGPSRDLDDAIWLAVTPGAEIKKWSYVHKAGRTCHVREERINGGPLQHVPHYTESLDTVRSAFGGTAVFASDIGADGLALVKLVADTGTTPIVEYTGIAARLEHAWLAAALRMKGL